MPNLYKKCNICFQEKSIFDFYKRSSSPDNFAYTCKLCDSKRYMIMKSIKGPELAAKQKEWRQNNKKRIRDTKRKSKYGLSGLEVDRLRAEQNYSCCICKKHESTLRRSLAIDHDHKTGENRGLLCDTCNRAIGLLQDNVYVLEQAVKYLQKYKKIG